MKGSVRLLLIAIRMIDFETIFINFVQFWINFHSFTWHWLDLYFVTKKILFDRQETLSRVLESTTAFVRFCYKAFLKLHFTIRNRVPLHFTIGNRVPYNKLLTNRACSGRTGEYWPSVVAVRTKRSSVRTAMTEGQYSPVRPSRSVSKRLILTELAWSIKDLLCIWHSMPSCCFVLLLLCLPVYPLGLRQNFIAWTNKSQAGSIAPSCLLVQPMTVRGLVHLASSQS